MVFLRPAPMAVLVTSGGDSATCFSARQGFRRYDAVSPRHGGDGGRYGDDDPLKPEEHR
ncbi:hypothetical protein KEM60_02813 [Austwickia sp. TVS 96-490-7B]|uniref:hypothetical protein n=1 Tax=Austwickia sp. TVS 96-490-7B TaxID=2830843 RepID=UPI001C58B79B|nr:hypothetical protein [Austwickia sp. TVS 96-490-7B]MBW3086585.1 hypothetical protein [Austwickia sp. TVS 96-490-7B]